MSRASATAPCSCGTWVYASIPTITAWVSALPSAGQSIPVSVSVIVKKIRSTASLPSQEFALRLPVKFNSAIQFVNLFLGIRGRIGYNAGLRASLSHNRHISCHPVGFQESCDFLSSPLRKLKIESVAAYTIGMPRYHNRSWGTFLEK